MNAHHILNEFYSNRISGFYPNISDFYCVYPTVSIFVGTVDIESYKLKSAWQSEHNCDLASVQCIDSLVLNSILGANQLTRTVQIWSSEPKSHLGLGMISS